MRSRSLWRALLCAALASLAASLASSVASAKTLGPWWHLSSSDRPTNLNSSSSRLEVQEVTVTASGGDFILSEPVATEEGLFENAKGEPEFAIIPDGATAAQVQAGLEVFYGAGNVSVTGEPEGGVAHYRVEFIGALAYQLLKPIGTKYSEEFGFTTGEELTVKTIVSPSVGHLIVTAANLGDGPTVGVVNIADTLPHKLRAVTIEGIAGESEEHEIAPVTCSLVSVTCTYSGRLPAFGQIEVRIGVAVEGAVTGELNEVSVSGGSAPRTAVKRPITISDAATPFGVEGYEIEAEEAGGASDTRAASHPFQLTTTFMLNDLTGGQPAALPKDLSFELPPGLIGNPTPFTRCTLTEFFTRVESKDNECPPSSVVGVARITVNEPTVTHLTTFTLPVFNLEPAAGEPARFGILLLFTPVVIDTSLRTGGDYGITVSTSNISQAGGVLKSEVTFWGAPGDARHDAQRGWGCLEIERGETPLLPCAPAGESTPPAFLRLPTSCNGQPLHSTLTADSWADPAAKLTTPTSQPMPTIDSCQGLRFDPSIKVEPDDHSASSASGYTIDVHAPQEGSAGANGLDEADLRNTTVTLPAGVSLNPASADGLLACAEGQIALSSPAADSCPEGAKVGTAEVTTPLLPNPLKGSVFVAEQNANPFGSLVAAYISLEDPVSRSRVKLAGDVHLSPTGQITTTFANTPQLPFEDFKLHFFGEARAALTTPPTCGNYTTQATFEPWSEGTAVHPNSTFAVTSGPGGAPCPASPPFAPSLSAGSQTPLAGAYTPFNVSLERRDGEQAIHGLQLHMPPGLSGILTGVPLCTEAQAGTGSCPAQSQIGESTVTVGVGRDPFTVPGGKVYLTGSYEGAPFGLAIASPAKAGPYDLGEGPCDCIIVRARLEVDPHTADITVSTDETGAYQIPSILQGIPLQIRSVNVTINRPGFTFNPTDCNPSGTSGQATSTEGARSPLSFPFEPSNCPRLSFAPAFKISTSGKTSKKNGASLSVKLTYPKAPFGSQANIASVKVDLPKQLPSRLTTLNKACLAATFEANPANCPPGSIVGHARAFTPVLPVPLEGASYFVSHGGEEFPSLISVLKGYGVTIDLVGDTHIKKGITSSTFRNVPDVPVSVFELSLPEGPYSALAANGSLCKSKLVMPTAFTAHNGATIHENTKIGVTSCKVAKAHRKVTKRHGVKRRR